MIPEEDIAQMLKTAWLPKRACRKDTECRLTLFQEDEGLDPDLRHAIEHHEELIHYFSRTNVMLPHVGQSYNLTYAIVRSLVLLGYPAKVCHLLDLLDPPETRAGINFQQGLSDCKMLAILGFYESTEAKPTATPRITYQLNQLECDYLLVTDEVLDGQTWWPQELIASFGEAHYLNRP